MSGNAIFGGLSNEGVEESQDRLGGFAARESDAYTGTIKAAYVGQSAKTKARSVSIIMDFKGSEYRETFWVTNKDDVNYYVDTKDGNKKKPLAGYTHVDDICQVTIGKGLNEAIHEEKVINLYDAEAKREIPKSVPMLVELLGKEVTLGILKKTKNKQAKNSAGEYVDTPDSRDENETDKVFHFPSNLTVVEARNKIQNPAFYASWVERNRGKTRDQRTIKDGVGNGQAGRNGRPNTPPQANGAAQKTSSLFGN